MGYPLSLIGICLSDLSAPYYLLVLYCLNVGEEGVSTVSGLVVLISVSPVTRPLQLNQVTFYVEGDSTGLRVILDGHLIHFTCKDLHNVWYTLLTEIQATNPTLVWLL